MNKLFVHHPVFRLLSPLFSGSLVYLFILLVNNNVEQLQEEFLGAELYLCIGLSFIIQEFSRFSLIIFEKLNWPKFVWAQLVVQIGVSIIVCIGLVTLAIFLYYNTVVGYSPNFTELLIFNSVFSSFTLIYIALYLSHQYLYKTNQEQMAKELDIKQGLEEDFRQFEQGINPKLLFESLENLIILVHESPEEAEDFIDHLAIIYRHLLSSRKKELIRLEEEWPAVQELIQLFNQLPYRKVSLVLDAQTNTWIIPGAILYLIELIIRNTINSERSQLRINIYDEDEALCIGYSSHDRINEKLRLEHLKDLQKSYSHYTEGSIQIESSGLSKKVYIPRLGEVKLEVNE